MQKIHIIIFIAGVLAGIGADKILFSGPVDELAKLQLQDRERSQQIMRQAEERNRQVWGGK